MTPVCPARPHSACPVTTLDPIGASHGEPDYGTPATPNWSAWSTSQAREIAPVGHGRGDAAFVVIVVVAVVLALVGIWWLLHGTPRHQ